MKTIQIPSSLAFDKKQGDCVEENDSLIICFPQAGTFKVLSGGSGFYPPITSMHVNAGDRIGPSTAPATPDTLSWEFTLDTFGGDIEVKPKCPPSTDPTCK